MIMNNTIDIIDELSKNFLISSLDTNMGRAFPDVRDGLKPGQRCILWEMWTKKYLSSKPHVKSAKISGGVIAMWHPHSDVAIYDTFARMSQPFTNNIPEIDFHGNNGNIILGGDAVANQRYTEARLSKIIEDGMFTGIDKNNVDMVLNFSEDAEMPKVLPAIFPRLLVNGAQGIGVSLSNYFIPHNFTETGNLILNYLKTGILNQEEYYPDFPTGGTIINKDELASINKTGRGKVIVEASYKINGKEIDFYEMPYQVYIEPVLEQIKEGIEKEKIFGIKEVLNKSDRNKISLVVVCNDTPEKVLNLVFENTDLRKQYNVNQNGIISKTPILLNLQQIIDAYTSHNLECIKKEYSFDYEKSKERIHILEGLIIAINNIDEVINIIRYDENPEEKLIIAYKLDEEQVKAILNMRLVKLSKLEVDSVINELNNQKQYCEYCFNIINNQNEQKNILIERLSNLVKKYGDVRRTKIEQKNISRNNSGSLKSTKKEPEQVIFELTKLGYLKSIPLKVYRKTNNSIMSIKSYDDDTIILFSSFGKVYRISGKNIKKCNSSDKGTALGAILSIDKNEKILFATTLATEQKYNYLLFTSKLGMIKKTVPSEYMVSTQNLKGTVFMKLKQEDSIVSICHGFDGNAINLITENGIGISFFDEEVSYQGKTAGGVKGISLNEEDFVKNCSVGSNKFIVQKRGGKGKKFFKK